MDTNLVPISQVVKATKTDKIHLAYLTKLRLLPQTIRRKIDNRIEGCYPEYVIPLLSKIESLKNAGLTYSQIKFQLREESVPAYATVAPTTTSSPLVFLIIGLILGYLLATNKPPTTLPAVASAQAGPLDETSKTMLKVVAQEPAENNPIYLIAVPKQNLYNLGPTNINDLVVK